MSRKKFQKLKRMALGLAALLLVSVGCFSCVMKYVEKRDLKNTPRDPETHVIVGAETVELGDPDAEVACLLLHGFLGTKADLGELGDRLAEAGYFVRIPRLPGHGTLPADLAEIDTEKMIAGVTEEFLGLKERFDRVAVVGFSMGGSLAAILAEEQEVDQLVLIAPAFDVTYYWYYVLAPETWNRLLSPVVSYVPKSDLFVKLNRREQVKNIYSYRTVPTSSVTMVYDLGRQARQVEAIKQIDCPVLLLHSRGDEAASPEAAELFFEAVESEEKEAYWYTKRSNHILLWDHDREDVIARVVDFIR